MRKEASKITKVSGLGDNFLVGGYDLSGDIASLESISQPMSPLDVTAINESAHERIGGMIDGSLAFTSFFNPVAGQAHPILKALPRTDVQMMYLRGTVLGNSAAAQVGKQVDYAPKRGTDGSLTVSVSAQANGFGLEWGQQVTAGLRTDTVATAGSPVDFTAATSFGFQAYLQVTAFTGTDVTVKLQDATTSGGSYSDVAGGAFAQTTAAHTVQRISSVNTATVREFVKATTVTTGGFTSVTFCVILVKNTSAGVRF